MISGDGNRELLNRTAAGVAAALVVILGVSLYLLMKNEIPDKNHDIILILVTTDANAILAIVSYFFGSSSSNKAKDETISAQAATIATTVPAVVPSASVPLHTGESATAVGP